MKNVNKEGGCVHKLFRSISSPVEITQMRILRNHGIPETSRKAGLPLSFLNWAYIYVRQGVYFWAYGTPGVSIFGVFRMPSLPIFGVIFGLPEATRMPKISGIAAAEVRNCGSGNLRNSGSTPVSMCMQECILISSSSSSRTFI